MKFYYRLLLNFTSQDGLKEEKAYSASSLYTIISRFKTKSGNYLKKTKNQYPIYLLYSPQSHLQHRKPFVGSLLSAGQSKPRYLLL